MRVKSQFVPEIIMIRTKAQLLLYLSVEIQGLQLNQLKSA